MSKKYTSDDNRSMQLNPNNDRYWSVRDSEYDDDFEVDNSQRLSGPPATRVATRGGDIASYINSSRQVNYGYHWDTFCRRMEQAYYSRNYPFHIVHDPANVKCTGNVIDGEVYDCTCHLQNKGVLSKKEAKRRFLQHLYNEAIVDGNFPMYGYSYRDLKWRNGKSVEFPNWLCDE